MKTPANVPSKKPARSKKRGQGMTEYVILVALIGIASISVVTLFGNNVRQLFASSAEAIAGNTSVVNGGQTAGQADVHKTLATFGDNRGDYAMASRAAGHDSL